MTQYLSKRTTDASAQRTFASLHAVGPSMIKICVSCISTILEPSAAASTAAAFAGFLVNAALYTPDAGT